ncbi:MAG: hypothetical protein AB8F95_08125 [Bacteroidia bacterium]
MLRVHEIRVPSAEIRGVGLLISALLFNYAGLSYKNRMTSFFLTHRASPRKVGIEERNINLSGVFYFGLRAYSLLEAYGKVIPDIFFLLRRKKIPA